MYLSMGVADLGHIYFKPNDESHSRARNGPDWEAALVS